MRFPLLFSICCLVASTTFSIGQEGPSLTTNQWSQLKSGQPILFPESSSSPYSKGGHYVTGAILVDDPVNSVWNVVADAEAAPNYMDDMVSARIIQRDQNSILVEQGMRVKGFRNPFNYVVRIHPTLNKQVSFKMEKGKLRAFDGGWFLFPIEGGARTLLLYSLHLDPGRIVPKSMVKNSLNRKIPEALIDLRDEVSRRSKS